MVAMLNYFDLKVLRQAVVVAGYIHDYNEMGRVVNK